MNAHPTRAPGPAAKLSCEPTVDELRATWAPRLTISNTAPGASTYRRGVICVRGDVAPPTKVLLYAMDGWRTSCADFFGGRVTALAATERGELRFDVTVYTD